jgi:DNA-binding IclR family transcriptional regulator
LSTLSNAAAILRLFAPDRLEISVTEVSTMLGCPRARVAAAAGDAAGGCFRGWRTPHKVGNLLFEISQLYRLHSSLIEAVDEAMHAICRENRAHRLHFHTSMAPRCW